MGTLNETSRSVLPDPALACNCHVAFIGNGLRIDFDPHSGF
jgi:hypothetical protein